MFFKHVLETTDHFTFSESDYSYEDIVCELRHKEKIVLKKMVCTVVKKYKEHGTIGHSQGSGKLSKFTTEALVEANAPTQNHHERTRSRGRK